MDTAHNELKERLVKIIDFTREELMGIRTGKASPALVENIMVDAYGGTTKLRILELASVSVSGPSQLLISPFDPATVQEIERAIHASPLHLTPRVEGKLIRIDIPPLSAEQRHDFQRLIAQTAEKGREQMRTARDDARRGVKGSFEAKTISEDEKFRLEREIDKITQEHTAIIDEMKEKKEVEVMEV